MRLKITATSHLLIQGKQLCLALLQPVLALLQVPSQLVELALQWCYLLEHPAVVQVGHHPHCQGTWGNKQHSRVGSTDLSWWNQLAKRQPACVNSLRNDSGRIAAVADERCISEGQ
jgi:hypothetical protein